MNCIDFDKINTCPNISCEKVEVADFRKVVIPAIMGDDTGASKPSNGAYHNAIVEYEANNHIYIYGTDGIPVSVNNTVVTPESLISLAQSMTADQKDRLLQALGI